MSDNKNQNNNIKFNNKIRAKTNSKNKNLNIISDILEQKKELKILKDRNIKNNCINNKNNFIGPKDNMKNKYQNLNNQKNINKNINKNIKINSNNNINKNHVKHANNNNINNNKINNNIIINNDNKLKKIINEFYFWKKRADYKNNKKSDKNEKNKNPFNINIKSKINPFIKDEYIFHKRDNLNDARLIDLDNKDKEENIDLNPANINIAELIGEKEKEDRDYLIKNLIANELINVNNLEEENKECSICLEVFQKGNKIISLPCAHIYHNNCIKNWLLKKNFCPICKYEFTKDDFH